MRYATHAGNGNRGYASAGKVLGFATVAAVFTASLLTLAALHRVGTEVFIYGLRKVRRPARKDLLGSAADVAVSAVLLVTRSRVF